MAVWSLPGSVVIALLFSSMELVPHVSCACTTINMTKPGQFEDVNSPNFPSNYDNNLDQCTTIDNKVVNPNLAQSFAVMLTFESLQMEHTDIDFLGFKTAWCTDYIKLKYKDMSGKTINSQNMCTMPKTNIYLSPDSITLEVKTSFSTTDKGFEAKFTSVGVANRGPHANQHESVHVSTHAYMLTDPGLNYMVKTSKYPSQHTYTTDESFTIYIDPSLTVSDLYIQFNIYLLDAGHLTIYDSNVPGDKQNQLYSNWEDGVKEVIITRTACQPVVRAVYYKDSSKRAGKGLLMMAKLVARTSTKCGPEETDSAGVGVIIGIILGILAGLGSLIGFCVCGYFVARSNKKRGTIVSAPRTQVQQVGAGQGGVVISSGYHGNNVQVISMQGQPMQGQPMMGQPMMGQPIAGQPMQPYPRQPHPMQAQPIAGQPMQPYPMQAQPMPPQPMMGQPMPPQSKMGQPMPGEPMIDPPMVALPVQPRSM